MDQKQISRGSVYDRLPPLSVNYPWLVAQNLEPENDETGDQIFFTINDPKSQYRCQIPELLGKRIRACFHGWVILTKHPHDVMWSLWNPTTSKLINLPPLTVDKEEDYECCLSSAPDDPAGSILLLTTSSKPTFVFCRLDRKRKKLKWTEMSYANQLTTIVSEAAVILHCPTYCNGKVCFLSAGFENGQFVVEVDIVFKDTIVKINLLPLVKFPPRLGYCNLRFLKVFCSNMYFIYIYFTRLQLYSIKLQFFKLDMSSMLWEEVEDLKDAIFFVDFVRDYSVLYSPAIASDLGGYIHILHKKGKVLYSYDIKRKTMSLSCIPYLDLPPWSKEPQPSYVSAVWAMPECRLQGDDGEIKCGVDSKQEEDKEGDVVVMNDEVEFYSNMNQHQESHLNIPFHVLEMIMEFCDDVDYLNVRSTCKQLAALPMIRWSNITSIKRLQTYPLVSPLLMMLDKHRDIITFTDPMFGDKYFIKTPRELVGDFQIYCSMYGWLLMSDDKGRMMLYNPFTGDIREIPCLEMPYFKTFCFSAPPTSPDCMVVGLTNIGVWHVYIHYVAREQSWRKLRINFDTCEPDSFPFPTFLGRDTYFLNSFGGLEVLEAIEEEVDYLWIPIVVEAPRRNTLNYFLVKWDRNLLLVSVDEFGEFVEVYRLNDSTEEWENIDSLGKHMIYVCDTTCLCVEAKIPEMENKIYFARLHSNNGKIVFYSLETCKYHTFDGEEESFGDFFGTKQYLYPQAWIQPSR